jgi:hypothetical protein
MTETRPNADVVDEWTDEQTGFDCKVWKSPLGHYCGYVRVPAFEGEAVDYMELSDVQVNGGLTYGADSDGWVGFDTAHYWDVCLDESGSRWGSAADYFPDLTARDEAEFWRLDDVRAEVERLAEQLGEL